MKACFKIMRTSKAFTLVEVTLAIGITAVALVSLMGMLPRGFKTLQRSADKVVMGRIHQQILGEVQLTPWEKKGSDSMAPIDSFDGLVRFYDDQGIEIAKDSGSRDDELRHVYTARISVPKSRDELPVSVGAANYHGTRLPGDEGGGDSDSFLRLVIVEITNNVDERFLEDPEREFDGLDYPGAVSTYRTIIAKMGRKYEAGQE